MKLPRVDRFLFFFRLEIGGYAIAGLSILFSIFFIAIFSIFMTRIIIFYNSLQASDREFFQLFFIVSTLFYTAIIVYFAITFATAIMLILGTAQRHHKFLVPHQVITAVFIVTSFILLFQFTLVALFPAMLSAVLSIYFLICINSLYLLLKAEAIRKTTSRNGGAGEAIDTTNF